MYFFAVIYMFEDTKTVEEKPIIEINKTCRANMLLVEIIAVLAKFISLITIFRVALSRKFETIAIIFEY